MNIIFMRGQGVLMALCVAAMLVATPVVRADQGDSPEVEAQRLVHLLGYISADYGGAVAGGVITAPAEYEEQLSLAEEGAGIAGRIQRALPADQRLDVPARVAALRALLARKADPAEVTSTVASLRAEIIGAFQIEEAPRAVPNAERGRALYLEHCATCHGAKGAADTARAATLSPRPANFLDPVRGEAMTPFRVASTVRFGVQGTAMVPFTFLPEAERWDLAFYVTGLRHEETAPGPGAPAYTLAELAVRSDADLRRELRAAGVAADRDSALLSDLRRRAPYDDRVNRSPLGAARVKLDRARVALARGELSVARGHVIDAYLEGIEPTEAALRAAAPELAAALEEGCVALRGRLDAGASAAEIEGAMDVLLRDIARAEAVLSPAMEPPGFFSTALSSAGIVVREGVEAALLIAALLGVAAQAGLSDRKRYVHVGWVTALVLGCLTWFVSSRIVSLSGASRELIEGITALLATAVLFYVSYSLISKREVARWMSFLRAQVTPRRAALSLFGVALLAAYREVFETVLFYQALLASSASATAALVGAAGGALALATLVVVYTRAGRFAPPQVFFRISSVVLYVLAVIFAGQGVAALQTAGKLPVHSVALPSVSALGVFPTVETLAAQLALVVLALLGVFVQRRQGTAQPKPAEIASGGTA